MLKLNDVLNLTSFLDKPKPPGVPNASEIADNSLTLSWKVPDSDGGSPITNYIIEFHDRNTLRWSTYNESFTIDQPFTKGKLREKNIGQLKMKKI